MLIVLFLLFACAALLVFQRRQKPRVAGKTIQAGAEVGRSEALALCGATTGVCRAGGVRESGRFDVVGLALHAPSVGCADTSPLHRVRGRTFAPPVGDVLPRVAQRRTGEVSAQPTEGAATL
jgi:hypothetical protein